MMKKTILIKLKQLDWIIIFVCLLGVISIIQHALTRPINSASDDCFVTVQFQMPAEVRPEDVQKTTQIYLLNAYKPSDVVKVNYLGHQTYQMKIKDRGAVSSANFICAGQNLELGQTVRLNGLINAEGKIIKIDQANAD